MKNLHWLTAIPFLLLLSACSICGDNDAAIAKARSLSLERLQRLAADLSAFYKEKDQQIFDSRSGIPPQFTDLHPVAVMVGSSRTGVHLSGCADDKVLIILKTQAGGRQELVLLPGEAKDQVLLWRSR